MRYVLFKKWIDAKFPPYTGRQHTYKDAIEGTGCWSDFIYKGTFHQWATAYEEFENTTGNYTVGLVELTDGTIESVLPSNLKFV